MKLGKSNYSQIHGEASDQELVTTETEWDVRGKVRSEGKGLGCWKYLSENGFQ